MSSVSEPGIGAARRTLVGVRENSAADPTVIHVGGHAGIDLGTHAFEVASGGSDAEQPVGLEQQRVQQCDVDVLAFAGAVSEPGLWRST